MRGDGSIIVAGSFFDELTLGLSETGETSLTSDGGDDVLLAAYDAQGALLWGRRAGGTDIWDRGNAVAALSDDSFVVTGTFQGSATFGPDEANETVLDARAGRTRFFIAKFRPNGRLDWVKSNDGTASVHGNGVAVSADGAIAIAGRFTEGEAVFGSGEANETTLSTDSSDAFVARYAADGSVEWVEPIGGLGSDEGHAVTTTPSGAVVTTGYFEQRATFGSAGDGEVTIEATGDQNAFIARYGADGVLSWARQVGGEGYSSGLSISAAADDAIAVGIRFDGSAVFGPGEVNETSLQGASADVAVARYDAHGSLGWVSKAGGQGQDSPYGIRALPDGSVFVTGEITADSGATAVFGRGEPRETLLENEFGYAAFVARYDPDGSLRWARGAPCATSSGAGAAYGIDVQPGGSAVITGLFVGEIVFGEGEANETRVTAPEDMNLFVARLAP